jgi:hypothetical protein
MNSSILSTQEIQVLPAGVSKRGACDYGPTRGGLEIMESKRPKMTINARPDATNIAITCMDACNSGAFSVERVP